MLPTSPLSKLRLIAPALALAALLSSGCTTLETHVPALRSLGVYRIDINQGNYLSQDMVDKLKVGQSKPQVRQLLGTALLVSPFRESRWDYVYLFTRQGFVTAHRTFTLYFVDDKLARWEGDELPPSMAELNREALARTSGEDRWGETRSWWDDVIDVFGR